jgi:hypothetical protein
MDEANQSDRGTTIRLGLGKLVDQFWILFMN